MIHNRSSLEVVNSSYNSIRGTQLIIIIGRMLVCPKQCYPVRASLISPFIGGFLTSWNKLCFTGGLLEGKFDDIDQNGSVIDAGSATVASVQLPGSPHINGLWVG